MTSSRPATHRTVAVAATVLALAAWSLVPGGTAEGRDPLPDLGLTGATTPGVVDDGDTRARLLVTADVLAASAAAARTGDRGGRSGSDLSDNDQRLLEQWHGTGDDAPTAPAGDPVELASTALRGVEGVDDAVHVVADLFEVTLADTADTAVRARVASVPGVQEVGDVELAWPVASDDEHFGLQWGLTNTGLRIGGTTGTPGVDIGYADARAAGDGSGVVVAVVDSGIDLDHPDLRHAVWTNPGEVCGNGLDDDGNGHVDDCHGWDFVHDDGTVDDPGADNLHGTHVAGTVAAASGNGIGVASLAPGVTIMSVKVFDGGGAPMTRIARAVGYALDNGADVINLSLGGDGPDRSLERQLQRAEAADVLVVAAAGNAGRDIDRVPFYPASYGMQNLLSVGSHRNDGTRSGFSNHGARSVDLFAPGSSVMSTVPDGGYAYMHGTSMATPMVASVAAVTAQVRGTTSAVELKAHLMDATITEPGLTSVTGGRTWAPAAIGTAALPPRLVVTANGLDDPVTGEVPARLSLAMRAPDGATVELRATLARVWDLRLAAVVDHPVTLRTATGSTEATTDASGALPGWTLDEAAVRALRDGTLSWELTSQLPPGEYVWVVQPVVGDAPADPAMTGFRVTHAEPPSTGGDTPTPAPDGGGAPAPVDGPAPDDGGGDGPAPDSGGDAPAPGPVPVPVPVPDGGGEAPAPDGGGDAPAPDGGDGPAPDDGAPAPDGGDGPAPDGGAPAPDGGDGPAPDGGAPAPDGGDAPGPDGGETPAPDGGGTQPPDGGAPAPGVGDDAPPPTPDETVAGPVRPRSGPALGGTVVTVTGRFDPTIDHYVHIGDLVLAPVAVIPSELTVITTNYAPGTYDVRVYDARGRLVVEHPAAFSFTDGDAPPPAPDGGVTPPPAPDGGGDAPAPAPDGGGGPAPTPTPDDGTAPPPAPTPPSTRVTAPDGMVLETATTGVLAGLDRSHWMQSFCSSDPCTSVLLDA